MMFTGIVQHVGRVVSLLPTPSGKRLVIDPEGWMHEPAAGDSISISGCCLTVVDSGIGGWAFDVVPETLAKTTLGTALPGSKVNLEHAATPTTLLGGHLVQGHIDAVGRVTRVKSGADWRLELSLPRDLMPYMIPKGSICVDGVSLTIADIDPAENTLQIALIPTTLARTTLGGLSPGDTVNIETDSMVRAVVHILRHYAPTLRSSDPS